LGPAWGVRALQEVPQSLPRSAGSRRRESFGGCHRPRSTIREELATDRRPGPQSPIRVVVRRVRPLRHDKTSTRAPLTTEPRAESRTEPRGDRRAASASRGRAGAPRQMLDFAARTGAGGGSHIVQLGPLSASYSSRGLPPSFPARASPLLAAPLQSYSVSERSRGIALT